MKLINYETKLNVTFAVLDDDGDVTQKVPLVFEIPKHTENFFAEAYKAVMNAKSQVLKNLEASQEVAKEEKAKD